MWIDSQSIDRLYFIGIIQMAPSVYRVHCQVHLTSLFKLHTSIINILEPNPVLLME